MSEYKMRKINISTKKHPDTFALVDNEDFENINKHKWGAVIMGNVVYARRGVCIDGEWKSTTIHKAIMGEPPKSMLIDHINGDGLDNRRCNLRFVTNTQNHANSKSKKINPLSGGLQGAYKTRTGMFQARIKISGACLYLGVYPTAIEAHNVHKKKHIEVHGEFSKYYNGATV